MAGAFYAFINIKAHLGRNYGGARVDNSTQWCLTLLEQQNVATVMGSAFGAEGYARISFATSLETLEAGFDRIEAFLTSRRSLWQQGRRTSVALRDIAVAIRCHLDRKSLSGLPRRSDLKTVRRSGQRRRVRARRRQRNFPRVFRFRRILVA